MDTTAISRLPNKAFTAGLNAFAAFAVVFELYPYFAGSRFNPDLVFWYSRNGFDHVLSAACPLVLFVFVSLESGSRLFAVKGMVAAFFVSAMEVFLSDAIVLKIYYILPYDAFVACALASVMLVWSRFDKGIALALLVYSLDMVVFWCLWSLAGIHSTYTGEVPVRTAYYGDWGLNLLQIAGWVFACAWFRLRVQKW